MATKTAKAKLIGPIRAEITDGTGRDGDTYKDVVFYGEDNSIQFGLRVPCEESPNFPAIVAAAIRGAVNDLFRPA